MDSETGVFYDNFLGCLDWIMADLKRMRELKAMPNTAGNCNIPIALYAMTVMRFLGSLLPESQPGVMIPLPDGDVKRYVQRAFDDEDKDALPPEIIEEWYYSMTRMLLPPGWIITRGEPELIIAYHTSPPFRGLDADRFAEMAERSIVNFDEMLRNDGVLLAEVRYNLYKTQREMKRLRSNEQAGCRE